jgi:hypothetical protein
MSGRLSGLARTGAGLALLTLAAACAQAPKPAAPSARLPVAAAPAPAMAPRPDPVMDPDSMEAARADLKLLGYAAGKLGDAADLSHAILAFEKDQGLAEDGRLTPALAERLKHLRAELPKPAITVIARQGEIFVYSDGSQRRQPLGILLNPPPGLVSDVPANFLRPMRPGLQGSYHLGVRAKDGGFSPVATVTCRVDKIAPINSPAGLFDSLPVTCRTDAKPPAQLQWRSYYAVKLGQVIRQQAPAAAGGNRDLIAIRPFTANWPSAARAGLDWALAHALETPASTTPVLWSSTAVPPHFEIHAYAALSPRDAGLPGGDGPSCRRFDLAQSGGPARLYPGIACRDTNGAWTLPESSVQIAAPANGFEQQSVPAP